MRREKKSLNQAGFFRELNEIQVKFVSIIFSLIFS